MCGQSRRFRCCDGLSVRVSVALAPALPTLAFHTERSAWPVSRGSERTPPVKLSYKAKPTVGTPATWLEGRQRCVAERFRLSLQFLSTIVGVFLELERAPSDGLSVREFVALTPARPTLTFHTERSAWPVSRGSERTPPAKLSCKAKATVGTQAPWLGGRQRCVAGRFRRSRQFLSKIVGVFLELERGPYVSRDSLQPSARYFSFVHGCAEDTGQKKKKKKWAAVTELHRRE
eukprot:227875_1